MYYFRPFAVMLAHWKRDIQVLVHSGEGIQKRLEHDLPRPTRRLFEQWARCRDDTLTRVVFQRQMKPIGAEIDSLLLRGKFTGISLAEEL